MTPLAVTLLLGLLAATPTRGLVVEAAAGSCPGAGEVEKALTARLPGAEVTLSTPGQLGLAEEADGLRNGPAGRFVALTLRDPARSVRLTRRLQVQGPDARAAAGCTLAAEAVALVVERFFRSISWSAGSPLPEALSAGDGLSLPAAPVTPEAPAQTPALPDRVGAETPRGPPPAAAPPSVAEGPAYPAARERAGASAGGRERPWLLLEAGPSASWRAAPPVRR